MPPHNLQAEESLLGAMLLSRDAIGPAVEACSAADFYKPAHAHIFEAIISLWGRGEPADPVTVADELNRMDLLEAIGGPTTLISLQANTPATSNASRYARIVEEHSLLRRLIRVAGDIAEMGYSVPEDITTAVDEAESMMFDVAQRRVADTMAPIRELLSQSLDRLESLYDRGESITGVPTGFVDLDERLSGLQPSALLIVGARPAMGKCVAWDTPIVDPTTGAVRTAADVHRAGRAGDAVEVLTLDEHHHLKPASPSAFVDDGVKPLFSVRTRLGRKIRTTLTHPFLTPDGWQPLGKLQVGTKVAVPCRVPVFGIEPLPEHELALMAYLLSESGCLAVCPSLVSNNTEAIEDAAFAAAHVGARAVRRHGEQGSTSVVFLAHHTSGNPVTELLLRHGLTGSVPSDRTVPSAVYRLPKAQLAFFLRRFLSVSGRVVHDLDSGGTIEFDLASEALAFEIQHLLLRFGISAALVASGAGAARLAIQEPAELRRFEHEIGMIGQSADLKVLVGCMASTSSRSLVGAGISAASRNDMDVFIPGHTSVAVNGNREGLPCDADIRWDDIVEIEYVGDEQVYDLTIPVHHNFVAGDVLVHNTSFALNIVSNAALHGTPVLYFSLEMSHLEITQRLLCSEARVDASRLRNGKLHDSDWPKINQAIGRLGEAPIFIDDNPNCTVMDIRAKARRLKATNSGLGLIVIDYLQLMSGRSNAENRQVEVSEMSRGLKILAREMNVPVIALSQLSRSLEMRADKRPILADLRESGSLEQDADVVMFLYRDEVYSPESPDKGSAEVIVAKHRNGPVGTTQLAFIDRYTRFANMARV